MSRRSCFDIVHVFQRASLALLIGSNLASLTSLTSAETIWQLGVFDKSSTEFSPINDPVTGQRRIDYSDLKQDPVFIVRQGKPARDWFSF